MHHEPFTGSPIFRAPGGEDTVQTAQPLSTPSVANVIVHFVVTPWGEVYVDGKRQGVSPPLTSVSIAPGKHRIEIKNTAFPPYSQTYEIKPNEKLKSAINSNEGRGDHVNFSSKHP